MRPCVAAILGYGVLQFPFLHWKDYALGTLFHQKGFVNYWRTSGNSKPWDWIYNSLKFWTFNFMATCGDRLKACSRGSIGLEPFTCEAYC